MKLKWYDRLLLALYAALGLALIAYVATTVVSPESLACVNDTLQKAWGNVFWMIALCALAALLVAWTARMLVLALRHEPRYDKGSVSIQNTEDGAVRISVTAMDALVRQAIGSAEGVIDIQSKIENHDDSISVRINMTLAGNAHIPNVTMLLQKNIKSFIEEFSGIAVRDVSVMVSSIVPAEGPVQLPSGGAARESSPIIVETAPIESARFDAEPDNAPAPEAVEPEATNAPEADNAYEEHAEDAASDDTQAR